MSSTPEAVAEISQRREEQRETDLKTRFEIAKELTVRATLTRALEKFQGEERIGEFCLKLTAEQIILRRAGQSLQDQMSPEEQSSRNIQELEQSIEETIRRPRK